MQQHAQKGIAVALAAREHADAFENVVRREEETSQQAAQFGLGRTRGEFADVIQNSRVRIEFFVLVLSKIIWQHIVTQTKLASGQRLSFGQQLDQCGFARSVYAYQRNAVATLDHEADIAKYFLLAVRFRHVDKLSHDPAAR